MPPQICLETTNTDTLRNQLRHTLLRGRVPPTKDYLLANLQEQRYDPVPTDEPSPTPLTTPDLSWRRVTLHIHDDADVSQSAIPLIVAKPNNANRHRLPCVVVLHGTGQSPTTRKYLSFITCLARRGFLTIGMTSRHHGTRAKSSDAYTDALLSAFRRNRDPYLPVSSHTHPFIYDTACDLLSVADYLCLRNDVDVDALGITGVSLGGMHAWFAAALDVRWRAVAPLIGVHSFSHSVENDIFQARIASVHPLFEKAAEDLSRPVDRQTVKQVWNTICPYLLHGFDVAALALICPRRVFIANGECDARCPVLGLRELVARAREASWSPRGKDDCLVVNVYDGVGHQVTELMWDDCVRFLEYALLEHHPSGNLLADNSQLKGAGGIL